VSSQLISSDLVPIGGGYVILMAALAGGLLLQRRAGRREGAVSGAGKQADAGAAGRPAAGRLAGRFAPGWPRFAMQVAATAAGGYVLLMAVLVAYYYGVSKVANHFLESALTGGLMLLAIAFPVFAIASRIAEVRRRRRDQSARH
jgi:Family of unknown function (DUF6256)